MYFDLQIYVYMKYLSSVKKKIKYFIEHIFIWSEAQHPGIFTITKIAGYLKTIMYLEIFFSLHARL